VTPAPDAVPVVRRLLVVSGPSGAGKSTAVAAAGVPALGLDAFYRDRDAPGMPRRWGDVDWEHDDAFDLAGAVEAVAALVTTGRVTVRGHDTAAERAAPVPAVVEVRGPCLVVEGVRAGDVVGGVLAHLAARGLTAPEVVRVVVRRAVLANAVDRVVRDVRDRGRHPARAVLRSMRVAGHERALVRRDVAAGARPLGRSALAAALVAERRRCGCWPGPRSGTRATMTAPDALRSTALASASNKRRILWGSDVLGKVPAAFVFVGALDHGREVLDRLDPALVEFGHRRVQLLAVVDAVDEAERAAVRALGGEDGYHLTVLAVGPGTPDLGITRPEGTGPAAVVVGCDGHTLERFPLPPGQEVATLLASLDRLAAERPDAWPGGDGVVAHGAGARRGGVGVAEAVAGLRVGIGAALLVAPGFAARLWVGEHGAGPGARVFARAIGARDVALGLRILADRRAGRPVLPAMRLGVASDAADAVATALAFRQLTPFRRIAMPLIAGAVAVAGAFVTDEIAAEVGEDRPAGGDGEVRA
jgi:uridine kinase